MKTKSDGIEPNFSVKSKFYCPVSPYILWHHGLVYKECPLQANNRDMPACKNCRHGVEKTQIKNFNNLQKVGKRKKETTPKIGKTYISK